MEGLTETEKRMLALENRYRDLMGMTDDNNMAEGEYAEQRVMKSKWE